MEEEKEIEESTSSADLEFAGKDEGIEEFLGDDDGDQDDGEVKESENDLERKANLKKAISVAGILVFGIGVLIFGGLRLQGMIEGSFKGYGHTNYANEDANSANMRIDDEVVAMRGRDTDGDGLSDYDETYVYMTSVYIDDTDSDGVSDFEEVSVGDDPLCPQGADCYGDVGETEKQRNKEIEGGTNVDGVDLEKVREMLIEQGVDSEVVMAVDDETLLQMYQATVEETGVNPLKKGEAPLRPFDAAQGYGGSPLRSEGLSAEEIRQYLIGAGVDEDVIMSIDDATLMALYLQALEEME